MTDARRDEETRVNRIHETNGDDPLKDWDLVPDMTGRSVYKVCREEDIYLTVTDNRLTCNEKWFSDALASYRPELYDRVLEYLKRPRRFSLTQLSDVDAEPVEWLWPDFIARGMVHLLVGYSKTNKSTLIIELAKIITRGKDWPCGAAGPKPGNVLLMSAEDSLKKTIKPRLDAAGGVGGRVFYLNRGQGPNPEDKVRFSLANGADLDELREMIDDIGISVVFIDPIDSFVGSKFDSNSSTDVRNVIDDLNDLADELSVAIVAMRHFRKAGAGVSPGRAQDLIMGSRAYEAGARITLMVTKSSSDPHDWSRTLSVMQSNIGPDSIGIDFDTKLVDGMVCCEWIGERRTVRPDELINSKKSKDRESAKEWLESLLTEKPVASGQVTKMADELGFKKRTLDRAKKDLGVESTQTSSGWWWHLPDQTPPGAHCQPGEVGNLPQPKGEADGHIANLAQGDFDNVPSCEPHGQSSPGRECPPDGGGTEYGTTDHQDGGDKGNGTT